MCITLPGKVIKKQGKTATVKSRGRQLKINLSAVQGVSKNDWVLIYGDLALQKISEKEAKEILKELPK